METGDAKLSQPWATAIALAARAFVLSRRCRCFRTAPQKVYIFPWLAMLCLYPHPTVSLLHAATPVRSPPVKGQLAHDSFLVDGACTKYNKAVLL